MIQMFHVYKYYGKDHVALDDINLKIDKGEFVFLVGSSGAGKSTLLKLMICEERAEQGQILIGGKNISRLKETQVPFLRRNIGFVFQDFKLIRRKTVYENIALPLEIVGAPGGEIRKRVHEVLKMVQLEHRRNQFPQFLSGGEQQRVAIARALINRPSLLLADEPTGNLDEFLSVEIMDLLKNIHISGTTVIVATHNQHLMTKMGKRTIVLQKGKIYSDGASA
ncbi:cell division ATP-binding protein FtsE [Candidatus Manganitrophus noduliformans]|uniref:Cell division ATP-binding protein FtsE n=1 Tax=Candidatus Manganitrophus noduliformans TaxID=2606439 RepID=A0A7X6IC76_9BACT|nr:cell division ATP-binding protein FtsE [Candidatus Manganitrophus noduliformans]